MIRIAITGPESSGKTLLAQALAKEIGATYIPEYARTFLEEFGPGYNQEDLDTMALGHLNQIEESEAQLLVVDTDFIVFKVWSEYKYDFASPLIHSYISEEYFDLHLLCAPDIPWEEDPLRENPQDREKLFEQYVAALERYKKKYIIVTGSEEERLQKARQEVDRLQRKL